MQTQPKLMKLTDVSREAGVPIRTLYVWIDTGRFTVPHIEGTKPRRWLRSDIEQWMTTRATVDACGAD